MIFLNLKITFFPQVINKLKNQSHCSLSVGQLKPTTSCDFFILKTKIAYNLYYIEKEITRSPVIELLVQNNGRLVSETFNCKFTEKENMF